MQKNIIVIYLVGLILLSFQCVPVNAQQGKDMGMGWCERHGNYRGPSCPSCNSGGGGNQNYTNYSSNNSGHLSARKQRFNDAVGLNKFGVALNKKARECWNNKDWDGAINYLKQAIQYYQLAVDKYPKEKTWVNNLSNNIKSLDWTYARQLSTRANELYDKGLYQDAEMTYRKSLEYDANDEYTHNNLGLALVMQGKYDAAVIEYKLALKINPKAQDVEQNLKNLTALKEKELISKKIQTSIQINAEANTYFEKGNYKEAELIYKKAIALNEGDKVIYTNLGRAQEKLGKYKEAEASFRKALQLDPLNLSIHFNLGISLFDQGRLKEAEAVYRNTIILEPNNASTYYGLGILLREEGLFTEAEFNFRKAIAIDPTDFAYYNYLAALLEKQGAYKEAEKEYQNILKLNPENKYAKEAITKLEQEGKIVRNQQNTTAISTPNGLQFEELKKQIEVDKTISIKSTSAEVMSNLENTKKGIKEGEKVPEGQWEKSKPTIEDPGKLEVMKAQSGIVFDIKDTINQGSIADVKVKVGITSTQEKTAREYLAKNDKGYQARQLKLKEVKEQVAKFKQKDDELSKTINDYKKNYAGKTLPKEEFIKFTKAIEAQQTVKGQLWNAKSSEKIMVQKDEEAVKKYTMFERKEIPKAIK